MKQLSLLLLTALAVFSFQPAHSQAVLNEIYGDPGSNNHEFFELYNTSISGQPVSMDNYTIVIYYENGPSEKGFYVLDFPNLSVGPKGYFVGASQMPFNFQGTTKSKAADFSWNDPQLLNKFGYLKKWTLTGSANTPDNLKQYTAGTVPTNLNDLFYKRTGNGASYSTMVYQGGKLVNAFFAGTGGALEVPSQILNMPALPVQGVTKDSTFSFTINFTTLNDNPIEGVTENAGTDNGYIRNRDGLCNYWGKSSANVQHTPGESNGGGAGIAGALSISSHIYPGTTLTDSAFINYNITGGPIELFPVNLQVYLDNGAINGQLDSADVFVGQHTETVLTDGAFTTKYMPPTQDLLLVAETSIGCLDQIIHIVPPANIAYTVLPVNITTFKATKAAQQNEVVWAVDENESVKSFELQKSYDGHTFTQISMVAPSAKIGAEGYTYKTTTEGAQKIYYRLKLTSQNNEVSFSKIVMAIQTDATKETTLSLLQNPVRHQLVLQFATDAEEAITMSVYNMAGIQVKNNKIKTQKGANRFEMEVGTLPAGTYIVQMAGKQGAKTTKFIKQ